jgi:hypothetical protein
LTRDGGGAPGAARGERRAALALTAVVAALAAVRALAAGGLWRDEAGAARLATLPTLAEVVRSFPHEAFPPLFPWTVRAYSHLIGGGDGALRAFGLAVVLAIVGVLWLDARLTARTVPLLSLALLGLDAPFLVLGESLRGYGLGSALVLLTYGLLAASLAEPPRQPPGARQTALAGAAAVASVQVVLGNAALVLALCGAAALVAAARRRFRLAAWTAGCGAAAALSLLPYAAQLAAARREWSVIVIYPVRAGRIWRTLAATLGPPPVWLAWLLLAVVGLGAAARELLRRRAASDARREEPEGAEARRRTDVAAFASLTLAGALAAQIVFLKRLGYTPRPWYFLPCLALVAGALDTLFALFPRAGGGRRLAAVRPAAAALAAVAQVVPLAQGLAVRQTNADRVAREVARSAAPQDLVVVVPWYYGVSFARYYHGAGRWMTLPDIADHRIHRYDLLKARLASRHPLDDLLQATAATLAAGHRVWLVGDVRWPRPGEAVPERPPAPLTADGWHDQPYLIDWSRQLGAFLVSHGGRSAAVPVPRDGPVSRREDLSLAVVQGWR